jgi:choline-glycine betaine transporter
MNKLVADIFSFLNGIFMILIAVTGMVLLVVGGLDNPRILVMIVPGAIAFVLIFGLISMLCAAYENQKQIIELLSSKPVRASDDERTEPRLV